MKKRITSNIAILGLFFVLAVSAGSAQIPTRLEVNIPFDFSAGKSTLKAGTYSVKRSSGTTLSIRSLDGKKTVVLNAPLTVGSRDFKAGERLVFNRYGEQYFLTQVWLSIDSGRQLFPSRAEISAANDYRLAHGDAKPQRVEIAVRGR